MTEFRHNPYNEDRSLMVALDDQFNYFMGEMGTLHSIIGSYVRNARFRDGITADHIQRIEEARAAVRQAIEMFNLQENNQQAQ